MKCVDIIININNNNIVVLLVTSTSSKFYYSCDILERKISKFYYSCDVLERKITRSINKTIYFKTHYNSNNKKIKTITHHKSLLNDKSQCFRIDLHNKHSEPSEANSILCQSVFSS